jgi:hypothetical protein
MPILAKAFARRGREFDLELDVLGKDKEEDVILGVSGSSMIKTPSDSRYCPKDTDERQENASVFSPPIYLI